MKKIILILACFSVALILSCGGGSESSGGSCTSNFDCPLGQVCSSGTCKAPGSSDDGSGEGGGNGGGSSEDGSGSHGGGSSSGNDGETTNDDDIEYDDGPITGDCEPGKVQKCDYQGMPSTEGVGPCKAATRTCKEEGSWGHCEGEVLPVAENSEELCTNGIDDDCDGVADNGANCSYWNGNTDPTDPTGDPTDSTGIDVGYTGDYGDAYQLPVDAEICSDSCIPIKADCLPNDIDEGSVGLCNGLDDDCDGTVDEGCPCSPGQTQPCFAGPPNFRNVGTCRDGVQTCKVTMRASTGVWGECVGGIKPSLDVCDNADNNCNGCADDKLCCQPPIDCAFDIGVAQPFVDKKIDGKLIYDAGHKFNDADTATWEWTLTKGPCDIVLGKTSFKTKGASTVDGLSGDGTASTTVSGVGLSQFKVNFQLSGSYVLHLKVTRANGEVYECEWVLRVVSDGLRIELCWDTNNTVDVDLHLGKTGKTTAWASNDCYYSNCKYTYSSGPNWGYANTDNYDKDGNWKNMRNPRLDIDNIRNGAIPENINVDNPNDGDTFRVLVRHFQSGTSNTHPVVNVYCGGTLKATYGVEPQVTNFNSNDDAWKVVEVKWVDDGRGFKSDTCELTPKWNDATGYVVIDKAGFYSGFNYTDW